MIDKNERTNAGRGYKGAYAYRRLVKVAPYSAKERLRKAIIACHGNLIAVAVVLGYSPYSDGCIEKWVEHFALMPEVVEARRKGSMKNLQGKPTIAATKAEVRVRKIIRDARKKLRIEKKRAEIEALLA